MNITETDTYFHIEWTNNEIKEYIIERTDPR